jgi:hypothetical protein
MTILLSFIQYYAIRGRFARLMYGMLVGWAVMFIQFGSAMFSFFVSSSIVYLMLRFLPRKKCGLPIMIFALSYLSYIHIWRIIYDYGGYRCDISLIILVVTCKYVSIGWCYQDGGMDSDYQSALLPAQQTNIVH